MEIKNVDEQKTLMIRLITKASELPNVMGEVYKEIGEYMEKKEIDFAGMPYAMYYNMDMEALDVEMGFPVAQSHAVEGRIKEGLIPGGKIATAIHTGPYAALENTYNALVAYVKEKGATPAEWMYEYYLNSPMDVKEEELQTRICFPVD